MIPSHLSEATFRIYEPHIKRAVERWPEETQYPPEAFVDLSGSRLSPHTWVARFRDAVVSVKRFKWDTNIDTHKLWSISGQHSLSVSGDGTVWFKHRGKAGRPATYPEEARALGYTIDADVVRIPWQGWSPEEVRALCTLIDKGRLTGPFLLVGSVDPALVIELEDSMNVSLLFDEKGGKTVVT